MLAKAGFEICKNIKYVIANEDVFFQTPAFPLSQTLNWKRQRKNLLFLGTNFLWNSVLIFVFHFVCNFYPPKTTTKSTSNVGAQDWPTVKLAKILFKWAPLLPNLIAFTVSPILIDTYPSQQHDSLHCDQMATIILKCLVICNNEKLPNGKTLCLSRINILPNTK